MVAPTAPIPDSATDKLPRPRRRIPVSLAIFLSALGILTSAGVLSVWLPYHREQTIKREILNWGGQYNTVAIVPDWLAPLVGEGRLNDLKVFDRVVYVLLSGDAITDAHLADLRELKNLESLDLRGTHVSDGGMIHLGQLPNLERLLLDETPVGDAGLVYLRGLRYLSVLSLNDTRITDAGIVQLAGLTNLDEVHLRNTTVTEAGVAGLQRALPQLKIQK